MALTDKLNNVAYCFAPKAEEPDMSKLKTANDEMFAFMKQTGWFPTAGHLLDVGCGSDVSYFIQRFCKEFPEVLPVFLDNSECIIKEVNASNKLLADGERLPFAKEAFDIVYAGCVIDDGIRETNSTYGLAAEAKRVLKPEGAFIFTYVLGNDNSTKRSLEKQGFKEIMHLQRIGWKYEIPTDTYAAR